MRLSEPGVRRSNSHFGDVLRSEASPALDVSSVERCRSGSRKRRSHLGMFTGRTMPKRVSKTPFASGDVYSPARAPLSQAAKTNPPASCEL